MSHETELPRIAKPWCTCALHYLCLEAKWLTDLIDLSEDHERLNHARLFAMILCAHRRIEIKRITRYYSKQQKLPHYKTYLKRETRTNIHAPTNRQID